MKNRKINFGDLINPEGLEKPPEGILTMELGGKKLNQLGEKISNFAENIEHQNNVQVGEVAELVAELNKALIRELPPEKVEALLKTLQFRFENEDNLKNRHPGLEWTKVQARLELNPEKLWSLNEMEKTGGEPDVVKYDRHSDSYVFCDCSPESPAGRRNCVYDRAAEEYLKKQSPGRPTTHHGNAQSIAAFMGITLLDEMEYGELQTLGKFDLKTSCWIKPPRTIRKEGNALVGGRTNEEVYVINDIAHSPNYKKGFRGSLQI